MKKTVLVSQEDNITSINKKLSESSPKDEIFIVVDDKGTVLEKTVNLKLIKKQIEKLGLNVSFVTNVKNLKTIASNVSLQTLSKKEFDNLEKIVPETPAKTMITKSKTLPTELKIRKISIPNLQEEVNDREAEKVEITNPKTDVKKKEEIKTSEPTRKKTSTIADAKEKMRIFAKKFNPAVKFKKSRTIESEIFRKRNRFAGKVVFSLLSFTVILMVFILFIAYPKVNLTLALDSESQKRDIEFKISKNISYTDLNQKIVPALVETKEVSGKKEVQTQTFDVSGEKSTGKVRMFNRQNDSQGLIANTQLRANGKIFRIVNEVRIPAASRGADGNLVPGSIEVDVIADQVGDDYNLPASDFVVVKLSESMQQVVYGKSSSNFSGGTTVKTPNISQNELNSVEQDYRKEFSEQKTKEVLDELNKNTSVKYIAGSEQVEIEFVDFSVNPGDRVDLYEVSAKGKVSVLGFKVSDFNFLTSELTKKVLNENQTLDFFDISNFQVISKNGLTDADLKAEVLLYIISDLNEDKVKREIAGESRLDARKILTEMNGVKEIKEFKFVPGWFKNVPVTPSNIKIKFEKTPSVRIENLENQISEQQQNQQTAST